MDFLKALTVLKKWRWTFIGVTCLSFALIALAPTGAVAKTIYQSQAKVLLTPPSSEVSAYGGKVASGADPSRSWFADPTILSELFRSEELLTRVQKTSQAKTSWQALQGSIEVEPLSLGLGSVKLFKISVTSPDPKESEKLTRAATHEFQSYVEELSGKEFASTRLFIEELVLEAEQRRTQSEEALAMVREKYLGDPSDEALHAQQQSLDTQRQEVSRSVTSLEAEIASVKSYLDGATATPPWAILEKMNGSLGPLEAGVSELKLELQDLRYVYTDENEKVIALKEQLARAEEMYQKGLQEQVTSLYNSKTTELQQRKSQMQSLSGELNTLMSRQMTSEDRRQVTKLERELSLWEENHLSLLQQLYQARVVEQSSRRQGSVNVLERPALGVPYVAKGTPVIASGRLRKLLMAVPFCLVLGFAAAFLREYLTASMKLRPRIEEALELPIIAVIPATPSELTINWETFKRPMNAVSDLVLARGNGKNGDANGHANGNGKNGDVGHANGTGKSTVENGYSGVKGRSADEFRPRD